MRWIARTWTPCSSSSVAAVCRPSGRRTCRTPARCNSSPHSAQSAQGSMGRPFGWQNTSSQSSHAASRSSCWRPRNALRAKYADLSPAPAAGLRHPSAAAANRGREGRKGAKEPGLRPDPAPLRDHHGPADLFLPSAPTRPDAVTHVQDVLAGVVDIAGTDLPDEFKLDVLGREVVEQAAAPAQQHRDDVQFQLVDLARS
jgi:hypothetical protein